MRQHLERRMEVLAREIAASKTPKIDAAANAMFEQIGRKHEHKAPSDWARKINGAAQVVNVPSGEVAPTARPLPVAAPPSAQNFKVGDRVRAIASFDHWHAVGDAGVVLEVADGFIVVRFDPSETTSARLLEPGTASYPERFESIPSPAPEPAATPVALGDGWLDCGPDMPDLPAGRYELRSKKHPEYVMRPNGEWSLRLNVRTPEAIAAHQYRKVLA